MLFISIVSLVSGVASLQIEASPIKSEENEMNTDTTEGVRVEGAFETDEGSNEVVEEESKDPSSVQNPLGIADIIVGGTEEEKKRQRDQLHKWSYVAFPGGKEPPRPARHGMTHPVDLGISWNLVQAARGIDKARDEGVRAWFKVPEYLGKQVGRGLKWICTIPNNVSANVEQ